MIWFDGEVNPLHLHRWRRFWGISEKSRSDCSFRRAPRAWEFWGVPGVFAQLGASSWVSCILLPLLSSQREGWKARRGGHGLPCNEMASPCHKFKPKCCFHKGPKSDPKAAASPKSLLPKRTSPVKLSQGGGGLGRSCGEAGLPPARPTLLASSSSS